MSSRLIVPSLLVIALSLLALIGARLLDQPELDEPSRASPVELESTPGSPQTAAAPVEREALRQRLPAAEEQVEILADPLPPSAPSASLLLEVRREDTLRPVPGATVSLEGRFLAAATREQILTMNPGATSLEFVTDAEGKVQFALPPDCTFALLVRALEEDLGHASGRVGTLRAGEERAVLIELPLGRDLVFHGRVLVQDDTTGQTVPLPRARVVLHHRSGPEVETTTAQTGRFRVEAGSWGFPFLEVRSGEYVPVLVQVSAGHETTASEFEVHLSRGATLSGEVLDDVDRPFAGATVELSISADALTIPHGEYVGRRRQVWTTHTDRDGAFELTALPIGVSLSTKVISDARLLLAGELTLQPGKNQVRWRVVGAGTIRGQILDGSGAPVQDLEIGALRTEERSPYQLAAWRSHDEALWTTRSGPDGGFAFQAVPGGTWLVGPVLRLGLPRAREVHVPPAQVVVPVEGGTFEVRLQAFRSLFLTGRVVDTQGLPRGDVEVDADHLQAELSFSASSDEDGGFRIGPVSPGDYRLEAGDGYSVFRSIAEVVAPAGGEEVEVVVLAQGGALAGVVLDDATQNPVRARVSFWQRDGWQALGTGGRLDGTFSYAGLSAGIWDLVARDAKGRTGVLDGVRVVAGESRDGLRIPLMESGTLVIRCSGRAEEASYRVLRGAAKLSEDNLQVDVPTRLTLPPGDVEVSFFWNEELVGTQRVAVLAGEVTEVIGTFEGE